MIESKKRTIKIYTILIIVILTGVLAYQWNSFVSQDLSDRHGATPATEDITSTVVTVGDVACDPKDQHFEGKNSQYCQFRQTYDLARRQNPSAVLMLGDLQYESATLSNMMSSYDKTWGGMNDITYPVPGNHEYDANDAKDYYKYLSQTMKADRADKYSKGYYSFNLNDWHIVALNSNCAEIGGCGKNSEQMQWLERDLLKDTSVCTLAFWHHPRFTSQRTGRTPYGSSVEELWTKLSDHGAEVVLTGHEHWYERFSKQSELGVPEEDGMRQFVVGTGGKSLYTPTVIASNSEKIISDQYGVMVLKLHPRSYEWKFLSIAGETLDYGSDKCVH